MYIREMTINDYDKVFRLWEKTEGMGLSGSDSTENIEKYLIRNPGLCFVAEVDSEIVGTILCGHDGRRGYIYHLAVDSNHRQQGIGSRLVDIALDGLKKAGITKCHLFVFKTNPDGVKFWRNHGWMERTDLFTFSMDI